MPASQIIALSILAFLIFWAVGAYNRLIRLRNEITNAFAQIDVQLKRRHDLIPNLVEVARKFLEHERDTLEAVVAARNAALAQAKKQAKQTTRKLNDILVEGGFYKALAEVLIEAHGAAAFALIGLVGLHVAAALKHQFIDRDGLIDRSLGDFKAR